MKCFPSLSNIRRSYTFNTWMSSTDIHTNRFASFFWSEGYLQFSLLSWRPKIWPALQITLLVIKRTILRAVKKLPYFLLLSSLHNIFEQLCTGFFPSINKEFKQVICRNARCRAILRYCSFFCLYLKSQNKWIIQRIGVLSITEF